MKKNETLLLAIALFVAGFCFGQQHHSKGSAMIPGTPAENLKSADAVMEPWQTTNKLIRITDVTASGNGNIVSLSFDELNAAGAVYCINSVSYSSTNIDLPSNEDLLDFSDFTCEDEWYAYDDLSTDIFVDANVYTVANVLAKTVDGQYFLYHRLFLRGDLEMLGVNITPAEFFTKLADPATTTKAFVLQNDLDCSGIDNSAKDKIVYNLYLYGNGHVLSHLDIITSSGYGSLGLVSRLYDNTYIANLGIEDSQTIAENSSGVGGLVGYLYNSLIENVHYIGSTIEGHDIVSGLVSYMVGSTIRNSYSDVAVTGTDYVAGLTVVAEYDSKIINCYSKNTVTSAGDYIAGLVSFLDEESSLINSYALGDVSGNEYTAGLVSLVDNESIVENTYATGNVTASGFYAGGLVAYLDHESQINNSHANGNVLSIATSYAGGLVAYVNNVSIVDNSYATGLVTSNNNYAGGLVSIVANNSVIINSHAAGNVEGSSYVGGLIGKLLYSSLENSYATGDVYGIGEEIGGLIGTNYNVNIFNSYSTGSVEGDERVGALLGGLYDNSLVENSYAIGTATGNNYVGGYAGFFNLNSTVLNSYCLQENPNVPTGVTQLTEAQFGDEASYNNWNFYSVWYISYTAGHPKLGLNYSGGSGAYNNPYLIGTLTDLEGLSSRVYNGHVGSSYFLQIADIDAAETQSWNSGTGFMPIGDNANPFEGSYDGGHHIISNLSINRPESNDIGLFGVTSGTSGSWVNIKNLGLVDANISGQDNTGGLAGRTGQYSEFTNCYVTGIISGATDVGGLIGKCVSTPVNNSYTTCAVSGTANIGGLLGSLHSNTLHSCYATGTVSGTSDAGSVCGSNELGAIMDCYFDTETTGMGETGCGNNNGGTITNLTGLSTEEFKINAFAGFNFGYDDENPWAANTNGRPCFFWQHASVSNGTAANNTFAGYAIANDALLTEIGMRYSLVSAINFTEQPSATTAGPILQTLTGLTPDLEYFAQAYAKDDEGRTYFGDMVKFTAEVAATPQPIAFYPENNATGVEIFNIVAADIDITVTPGDLSLISISPDPGNVAAILAGQKITIAHNDFEYSTPYTVTVPAGSIMHGDAPNDEFSWSFTTKVNVGIEETNPSEDGLSIFPNPSKGIFNVSTLTVRQLSDMSEFTWEVTDMHGAIIIKGNAQTNDFTINLSSHPKGIYFLKLTQEGLQTVKKLVLQ